eukprot:TRINITY_DN12941_c0_g1_i1.p1 TRINITY_DN12941_c0_g1~~TRINITY_DN12941_c0_g1_i1.p1  ORF type:complete len:882 (+),score=147.42 TRINITY_DN12941_c0_g1_i1:64-2709(+)
MGDSSSQTDKAFGIGEEKHKDSVAQLVQALREYGASHRLISFVSLNHLTSSSLKNLDLNLVACATPNLDAVDFARMKEFISGLNHQQQTYSSNASNPSKRQKVEEVGSIESESQLKGFPGTSTPTSSMKKEESQPIVGIQSMDNYSLENEKDDPFFYLPEPIQLGMDTRISVRESFQNGAKDFLELNFSTVMKIFHTDLSSLDPEHLLKGLVLYIIFLDSPYLFAGSLMGTYLCNYENFVKTIDDQIKIKVLSLIWSIWKELSATAHLEKQSLNIVLSYFFYYHCREPQLAYNHLMNGEDPSNQYYTYLLGIILKSNTIRTDKYVNTAQIYFTRAASKNHAHALYELGSYDFQQSKHLDFGNGKMKGDRNILKSAKRCAPSALYMMGRRMILEQTSRADPMRGCGFLRKAALFSHPEATEDLLAYFHPIHGQVPNQHNFSYLISRFNVNFCTCKTYRMIGEWLMGPPNPNPRPDKGVHFLGKAVELGDFECAVTLGKAFENGQGVAKDYSKAAECYVKAATHGRHSDALFQLAQLPIETKPPYSIMNIYQANPEFYDNAQMQYMYMAANEGHHQAQYQLALFYQKTDGGSKSKKYVHWVTKAAEAGNLEAQFSLGSFYADASNPEKNNALSVLWYTRAAELGHTRAQNSLGNRYFKGEGVAPNHQIAVTWYEKSAQQGYATAQNNIGLCYYNGSGVVRDYFKAFEWFKRAAAQNHTVATYHTGLCAQNGQGTPQDIDYAIRCFEQAAKMDYVPAMRALGECYSADGYEKADFVQSREWFMRAAQKKDIRSMFFVHFHLLKGLGGPKDVSSAYFMLQTAAQTKDPDALYYMGYNIENHAEFANLCPLPFMSFYHMAAERGHAEAKKRILAQAATEGRPDIKE